MMADSPWVILTKLEPRMALAERFGTMAAAVSEPTYSCSVLGTGDENPGASGMKSPPSLRIVLTHNGTRFGNEWLLMRYWNWSSMTSGGPPEAAVTGR